MRIRLKISALAVCAVFAISARSQTARPTQTFQTAAGPVKITPIYHAAVLIEAGSKAIYLDPAKPANVAGLPSADLILITDIHPDHMDPALIAAISKPDTQIMAPPAVVKTVSTASVIANGKTTTWNGWTIEAIPMYNITRGPAPGKYYHEKGRGNGYVLTYGGKRFYFSGDTENTPEMRALKNIDVAFVCINLPYTMPPGEAAEAVKAFHPKIVIPYHYRGDPPTDLALFQRALEGTGIEVRLLDWYPTAQSMTAIPKVTGPIPITPQSWPFLATDHADAEFSLNAHGYVENEYFVSGLANIYSWKTDGSVSVLTPNAPYTTRILVRRPKDTGKFSGSVIVELMNPAHKFDMDLVWGTSRDYFLARGDTWVGVTINPNNIASLKEFDPVRYSPLSMTNPDPQRSPCANPHPDWTAEPGLFLDMVSQIGALLKSGGASSPLSGFDVKYVYATAQTGGDIPLYVNAIAPIAKLASGKPVYDGYLIKDSGIPGPINQCAPRVGGTDPRAVDIPPHVPVIRVLAQSDVLVLSGYYPYRRADSDKAGDQYRLYEIPGPNEGMMTHMVSLSYTDINAFKGDMPTRCTLGTPNDFPMRYIVDGAFENLDQWVRTGKAPPKADRIGLAMAGDTATEYDTDQFGNAKGGIRTPYLDVPTATYISGCFTNDKRFVVQFARNRGYKLPFDSSRLRELYPTHADYTKKVDQEVDKMLRDGWLVQMDADKIKAEAASANVPE
jgi:L-ascorbate metabolism protein UlaG (beta-lactamase superfamily)